MQDHVHRADDVGEGLLLVAKERALLQRLYVLRDERSAPRLDQRS